MNGVRAIILGIGLALSFGAATAGAQTARSQPVRHMVELFTSQGCRSCPPANAVFAELADEPDVLALGYHVDYWDYIGWRDPFGTSDNTERQRAYARAFDNRTIYTPQMIINGSAAVVGSKRRSVHDLMARSRLPHEAAPANVGMRLDGETLHLTAEAAGGRARGGDKAVLMLIVYDEAATTQIKRGENAGETMLDRNIVRDWRVLGTWDGKPMDVEIPLRTLTGKSEGGFGLAAVLQATTEMGNPEAVLSAAKLEVDER